MKVNITGRHTRITEGMQDYARDKAAKLDRFFDRLENVEVVLDLHGQDYAVEMSVHLVRGVSLVGKANSGDMHTAIDMAEHKLERQIRKFHDRIKAHRDRTRVADGDRAEAAEAEETYEQVVREMLEEKEQ